MNRKHLLWTVLTILTIGLLLGTGLYIKKNTSHPNDTSSKPAPAKDRRKELYHCPMHPHITSDLPGTCPICHMDLQKVDDDEEAHELNSSKGEKRIIFYRHPMRGDITSPTPAKDEMGMAYIPVYEDEVEEKFEEKGDSGTAFGRTSFSLSQGKQQLIGVTTIAVTRRPLSYEIRSSGRVAFDPELYTAVEEYKQALLTNQEMVSGSFPNLKNQSSSLVSSSKTKLKLMGLDNDQIRSLVKNHDSSMNLLLPNGSAWIYAEVFEYEVGGLKSGFAIEATAPSLPGKTFIGKVESISPVVNAPSRTVRIRALVPDPRGYLRPDTFLNVIIKVDLGNKLSVPEDSVLHSGENKFVFVMKEKGRFIPRSVQLGSKTQDFYEVLSGLKEGERVVTAANFLIDSEAKLRAVLQSAQ